MTAKVAYAMWCPAKETECKAFIHTGKYDYGFTFVGFDWAANFKLTGHTAKYKIRTSKIKMTEVSIAVPTRTSGYGDTPVFITGRIFPMTVLQISSRRRNRLAGWTG